MSSATDKLAWGRVLGVYMAEGHLTVTELASTLLGRKVLSTARVPIGDEGPGKALGAYLESHYKPRQRRQLSVSIGLAAEQTFFTTRTLGETSREAMTASSLLASNGSASLDPATTTSDFAKTKIRRTTIYRVAACKRALAEEFSRALKKTGVGNVRLEPAAGSVLDAADRLAKPPRAWKSYVRVLAGESGGLAILVLAGKPMLWRRFMLAAGTEGRDIASAFRHVQIHAMTQLGVRDIAGIFLQGKADPSLAEALRLESGVEVQASVVPDLDDAAYSLAMAVAAKRKDPDRIDLFRAIRPPPSLSQMFPRKLAAGMVVASAVVGGLLWNAVSDLESECQDLHRQAGSYKWAASLRTEAIKDERKKLSDEVTAVERFLGTRVIWSNYLRDLPTRLPSNACFQSMVGQFEMKTGGKGGGRQVARSLAITGMARFADRGSAPREIDGFLDSLRAADLLRQTFPHVNLAEIRWRKEPGADIAQFTILATPPDKVKDDDDGGDKGKDKSSTHG
jgi:hypothetical protein